MAGTHGSQALERSAEHTLTSSSKESETPTVVWKQCDQEGLRIDLTQCVWM